MLGKKIKKIRELKNLTQEHLAIQLGLTQSAYSKIESGEADVPYSRLEQIAIVLELKPEEIITFNEHTIFNALHNNNENGVIMNQVFPSEKQHYEDTIKYLNEEIGYLKSMLEKALPISKKTK